MPFTKQDVTVFIVDDEFPIRDSLTMLIESAGLTVKSYDSALTFLDHFDPEQPGCLILDVRMPLMDGLELQEELGKRNIDIPIIFISGHGDIPVSAKAFRAGAVDFIEKPFENEILLKRLNEAIDQLVKTWDKCHHNREILQRYAHLTSREKDVMKLIANNRSNKQAARELGISNRTVDVHRAHIMEKMQADGLSELIVMAIACELI